MNIDDLDLDPIALGADVFDAALTATVEIKGDEGAADLAEIRAALGDAEPNGPPVISSNGGDDIASISVRENVTKITTVKAKDPDKSRVTYSIVGTGAELFTIDTKTGVLSFKSPPDFENPKDQDADNVYAVVVKASDGTLTDTQLIKVTVKDVRGEAVTGTSKADTLNGGLGNDTLDGRAGADTLIGGKGNDTYVVDNSRDKVVEAAGEGTDLVKASVSHTLAANVERLTLTGSKAINGVGNSLANVITGNSSVNTLSGGDGNDTLTSGASNDNLSGGAGNDKLYGEDGNDKLSGGDGRDMLYGGAGRDTISGGNGADVFVYTALSDSMVQSYDTISDFSATAKDKIDLSALDAKSATKANDAFVYIGTRAFSGTAGQLRFAKGMLQADVNGDRTADLSIKLAGINSLTAGNIIL